MKYVILFFQYDQELSVGEEELNLWDAAVREWDIEQAWECECNRYFSGLQCEIPGKRMEHRTSLGV